ncbi:MAG TPA: ABC transporter permease [Candidatus Solibacter sp.]|nr:ABC transporter permease [Candidatus Solibacter sp.]
MKILAYVRCLVSSVLHRSRTESEMDEELRGHIENRAEDLQRGGLTQAEAERRARMEFGGQERFKEECREERGGHWLETLWTDLRYGMRMLRKSPGFTTVAILTLALGIGATTAIFSVAYGILLRPLPYENPSRLVLAHQYDQFRDVGNWRVTAFDYLDWAQRAKSFSGMAAFTGRGLAFATAEGAELVLGQAGSANLFDVLGVAPVLGRGFRTGEDSAGNDRVVVLSYGLWLGRFAGNPKVIGEATTLNGLPYTIIGVMPRGFEFPSPEYQAWVPIELRGAVDPDQINRSAHFFHVVARLHDGVSFAQADKEIRAVAGELEREYPDTDRNEGARLQPFLDNIVGDVRPSLWLLLTAVLCLLIIACANVANLLLARATSREREIALRQALGAAQSRLFRQLLTENAVLTALGGGLGIGFAYALVTAMVKLGPASLPRLEGVRVDSAALTLACVTVGLTGVLFALAPMFLVRRVTTADALKNTSRAASSGGSALKLRSVLIVAEIAICATLLVSAGVTVRSLLRLQGVDPGFDPDHAVSMNLVLIDSRYPTAQKMRGFVHGLLEAVGATLPLRAAAISTAIPLQGHDGWVNPITVSGSNLNDLAAIRLIAGDYFPAVGTPLLRGRGFTAADNESAAHVAIVSQSTVRKFFGDGDPLGKSLKLGRPDQRREWRTVVGVVADSKQRDLETPADPEVFLPYDQLSDADTTLAARGLYLVMRSDGADPTVLIGFARTAIAHLDAGVPLHDTEVMRQLVSASVAQPRFRTFLFSVFGALALVLAAAGLYGVLSYAVAQRTHEIGIRVALGAQQQDVLKMVVGQGAKLVILGVAVGIVAALVLMRLMSSLLYGVSATDPVTFIGVVILLALVALAACWIPARRALKVDPTVALRYE